MYIDTEYFGRIEIGDDSIITFPEGIPGFEELRKFTLIDMGEDLSNLFWLQSVERPEICFVVTDPFVIYNGYEVNIPDNDLELLEITKPETVLALAIMVVSEDPKEIRVNLKAPVIINLEKKLGKQVLLQDESLPIRYYINRS
ncbi:MAG: flagellar assembly protein FliW [Clostridiaceae bacterium]|nr:flagellar assembly protein FliW [Clostridiaceae bacterium]